MKRVYKFEGIDCAVCAKKIEDKIAAIEGVISASVNFVTQKLVFEAENINEVEKQVLEMLKKEEPDVELERA